MIPAGAIARAVAIVGMAALPNLPGAEAAQGYPARPVRVVVAFAAGGFADTNARMITQKLGEQLGQNFVVDNRGGAGGNLGAKIVVDSGRDGYTLLATTAASSVAPSLYQNIGFDLLKDLAPVSNTVTAYPSATPARTSARAARPSPACPPSAARRGHARDLQLDRRGRRGGRHQRNHRRLRAGLRVAHRLRVCLLQPLGGWRLALRIRGS